MAVEFFEPIPAYESEGRTFESFRARQYFKGLAGDRSVSNLESQQK